MKKKIHVVKNLQVQLTSFHLKKVEIMGKCGNVIKYDLEKNIQVQLTSFSNIL